MNRIEEIAKVIIDNKLIPLLVKDDKVFLKHREINPGNKHEYLQLSGAGLDEMLKTKGKEIASLSLIDLYTTPIDQVSDAIYNQLMNTKQAEIKKNVFESTDQFIEEFMSSRGITYHLIDGWEKKDAAKNPSKALWIFF